MAEEERDPKPYSVDASPADWHFDVDVVPAEAVKVTDSSTPRYLPLMNGTFRCYSHVWVSVGGRWYDITREDLQPQDSWS